MPKISVIIPVYNTEKYLPKCLGSVINQTLDDIEIICINDCSTDNSLNIIKEYAAKDKRIKLINSPGNCGAAETRNKGIDNSVGEYIGFLDSDDFVDLEFFEKLYLAAKKSNAVAAKGNIYNYNTDNRETELTDFYNQNDKIRKNKAYFYYGFTGAIYKKSFLNKYRIRFPKKINYFEDPYFSIKAAINYKKIAFDDSAKYYYTQYSNNSLSKHITLSSFEDFRKSGLKIIDLLNKSGLSKTSYQIIFRFLINFAENNYTNPALDTQLRTYLFDTIIEFLFAGKYNYKLPKRILLKLQNQISNGRYYDLLLEYYKKYNFLNRDAQNVKIFISYIKPAFLFKTDVLIPVHLGRDVEKEISKDGISSNKDIKWLHKNCIGDNDYKGNISYLNRRTGFLTGTHMAWKNYEKIGNPEYFGSMGYRKLLFPNCLADIKKYDFIIPEKTEFKESLKHQFISSHGITYYEMMIDALKNVYPDELDSFNKYFNSHSGYFAEMYIMKRDLFFGFCEWIFELLNYLLNKYTEYVEAPSSVQKVDVLIAKFTGKDINDLNVKHTRNKDYRDVAFIIERLTGYYLYKLTQNKNFKYKTCNVFQPIIELTNDRRIYRDLMLIQMRKNVRSSLGYKDNAKNNSNNTDI